MSNPFVWRLAQGIITTVKVQKIRVEVSSALKTKMPMNAPAGLHEPQEQTVCIPVPVFERLTRMDQASSYKDVHCSHQGRKHLERGMIMNDTITQMRLSMRLDRYQKDSQEKIARKDPVSRREWDRVWNAADVARTQKNLTPELVDNVRLACNKL